MSSNVGLSTPRGSGTSGYVQRNQAFMKPRNAGYGAPYPPLLSSSGSGPGSEEKPFRQRRPDKAILEHDRRRAVEVKVLEERERLEGENERVLEAAEDEDKEGKGKGKGKVLSEEEIEERCGALRERLLRELEGEIEGGRDGDRGGPGPGRRQFKAYQVHELAEAKIKESERLRRALGIRGEDEGGRERGRDDRDRGGRRDREREREREDR